MNEDYQLNPGISRLLASYGDQLEYCVVEDMNEGEITTIASACKNVRFSVRMYSHTDNISRTLKFLRSQLEKIEIEVEVDDDESYDYNDFRKAWNECVNIRYLEFHNCNIEHAKAIMAIPKKNFTELHISPPHGMEEEVKKLLDIFAEGTVAVEDFEFYGRLSVEAMEKFVARNGSSLQGFSFTQHNRDMKMDTFLPLFLKCPAQESVRAIGDVVNECIFGTNMLKTLRSRGVACYQYSTGSYPSYS